MTGANPDRKALLLGHGSTHRAREIRACAAGQRDDDGGHAPRQGEAGVELHLFRTFGSLAIIPQSDPPLPNEVRRYRTLGNLFDMTGNATERVHGHFTYGGYGDGLSSLQEASSCRAKIGRPIQIRTRQMAQAHCRVVSVPAISDIAGRAAHYRVTIEKPGGGGSHWKAAGTGKRLTDVANFQSRCFPQCPM